MGIIIHIDINEHAYVFFKLSLGNFDQTIVKPETFASFVNVNHKQP